MPDLYIITGSNGAGKSSTGYDYLPEHLKKSVFDGDKLFMEKKNEFWRSGIRSPKICKLKAYDVVKESFNYLVEDALANRSDFAYEGHFTNHETWDIPKRFKEVGYNLIMIFFGLTDTDASQLRVLGRVNEGGHYVDPLTLESNFYGNLEKLDIYYKMFNYIRIFDTSFTEHIELAQINDGVPDFLDVDLPAWFTDNLKNIINS
ncbi:hypothetical protein AR438_11635 [Chryseobacterium aquaticum]|uniref:UDP-N-acetylglucosamine kinase n=1 Tax=Chryseobacterium aquaticum TaxID=452084 RepID=A0A0Q3HTS6_9FLAO|nr:hypothetical protein [Chryseobacterium aquaticum]KQK26216.1 hypothetical protein AR438_11635 [Chryseobacterium aquaticum]